MGQKIILCDTNIMIEFFKNNASVVLELRNIGIENIAISTVVVGELIYGALNKAELQKLMKGISKLQLVHLDAKIDTLGLKLMKDYSLSHNLDLPDAFIAATAISMDMSVYTLNLKHFHYLPNLKVYKTS